MTDRPDHDPTDESLLATLGEALRVADRIPEHVDDGARAALTWRTVDAELAALVFDSTFEPTGVRSDDVDRQITFRAPGLEIEVSVLDDVTRRLLGQLVPPAEYRVELITADDRATVRTDRLGRFAFDDLSPGRIRLVVLDDDGRGVVQTAWVQV